MAIEHSDLIIILGSRLSIPQTGYNRKNFSSKSKKIIIDIDINEIKSKDFKNIVYKLNIDLKIFLRYATNFFKKKIKLRHSIHGILCF